MSNGDEAKAVAEFRLTLFSNGRMEINVPRDLTLCLQMVSQFLASTAPHVQFKDVENRIVIPKIVLGKHNVPIG